MVADAARRWPDPPYKGLWCYTEADAPLFAGRDDDIVRCAAALAEWNTRVLLLHGSTGCGKSSFLRAGLIPYLESRSTGIAFARTGPADQTPALFVRATAEPLAKLANALYSFAAQEITLSTPGGRRVLNFRAALPDPDEHDARAFLRRYGNQPYTIVDMLKKLSLIVPETLVVVIDQGEEVLTVDNTVKGEEWREQFFEFLSKFSEAQFDLKFLIALRTEYLGRFASRLRLGFRPPGVDQYLLDELSKKQIKEAVERPTAKAKVDSLGAPYDHYRFSFDDGVVDHMIELLGGAAGANLAALQIVCSALYDLVSQRDEPRKITLQDLDNIGGVEGSVERFFDNRLFECGKAMGLTPVACEQEAIRWKDVLHGLTQLKSDGTLTTVKPVSTLRAELDGTRLDFANTTQDLLDTRLLREVTNVDRETGDLVHCFGLGHDRLGLVLRNWKLRHERQTGFTAQNLIVGRAFVKPALQALEKGLSEHALRLAAAGALLANDIDLQLVPELWSPAARAIFQSNTHAVLKGHTDPVWSAAFSPDGKRVATASLDRTARLWDAETGKQIAVLQAHAGAVRSAAFSPDGKRVATAFDDGTARLWDAETGKQIAVLQAHAGAVNSAAFSPDGKRVATASFDGTARLWNAETGNEIAVLQAHTNWVNSAAFSSDGKRVVTASWDHTARLWDAETGKEIAILQAHTNCVSSAAFTPDGKRVATASSDGTARLWDAETGKQTAVLQAHTGAVNSAAFSPDGKRVATASDDRTARLWDAETGKQIAVLQAHTDWVNSAAFSPDGKRVATASDDGTARLWDAETGKQIAVLQAHTGAVNSAAFNPDGERVVTASSDGSARLWDAETRKQIAVLQAHTGAVRSAAFSPDGKRVATASSDGTARLWDAETGKQIAVLQAHTNWVNSAAFSPDGKRVATASSDGTARLWDAETGEKIAVLQVHTGAVNSAAFSPDGKRVATASDDRRARLWDPETGKEIAVLQAHTGAVNSAAFSPDGKRVATASDDRTARLWDAETGKEIAVLQAHTNCVRSAAFSPDGKLVATASFDGTARLWNAETGNEIAVLQAHTNWVNSAAFSPDGKRVATGSFDGTVRLWDAEMGKEIAVLQDSGAVWSAAFSPDGKRVATASDDGTAWLWDVSRSEAIVRGPGACAHGGACARYRLAHRRRAPGYYSYAGRTG